MRVLVVDDEPAVRTALERALVLEGYEVDLAVDGGEALHKIAAEAPDALLLDVLMPGVDGLEVARRLRADGDRTPILMLTALARAAASFSRFLSACARKCAAEMLAYSARMSAA